MKKEILNEINRLLSQLEQDPHLPDEDKEVDEGVREVLEHLKGFVGNRRENGKGDSPDAPKIAGDLEEAANEFANQDCVTFISRKKGFIAGAEWQKEQMLKDAVEYKIVNNLAAYPVIYYEVNHLGLKYGDKVKIIILKEDKED